MILRFMNKAFIMFALSCYCLISPAQLKMVSIDEAVDLAIRNNKKLETYRLKAEKSQKLKGEAFNPGNTSIIYSYDENNVAENDVPLKVFGVEQSFNFPTVYIYRLKAARSQAEVDELIYKYHSNELAKKVSQAYYKVLVAQLKTDHFRTLDSLYFAYSEAASKMYTTGESNYLESLTSRVRAMQMKTRYIQISEDLNNELQKLQALVQADTLIEVPYQEPEMIKISNPDLFVHVGILLNEKLQKLSTANLQVERNMLLPDISLSYFQGTNNGENAKVYPGFAVGLAVPIFFGAQSARIQAAKIEKEINAANTLNYSVMLKSRSDEIFTEIRKYSEVLKQYKDLGKETSEEIMKYAQKAFQEGEIDFHTYISSLEEAINIELDYLDNLSDYNQAVLELNYLSL
jgi:cobalt-zinc-cadmium resistance protein CzcA